MQVLYPYPGNVVSPGVVVRAGRCPLLRCSHCIMVVLTDEETGQLPQSSHVEGFKHLEGSQGISFKNSKVAWKINALF